MNFAFNRTPEFSSWSLSAKISPSKLFSAISMTPLFALQHQIRFHRHLRLSGFYSRKQSGSRGGDLCHIRIAWWRGRICQEDDAARPFPFVHSVCQSVGSSVGPGGPGRSLSSILRLFECSSSSGCGGQILNFPLDVITTKAFFPWTTSLICYAEAENRRPQLRVVMRYAGLDRLFLHFFIPRRIYSSSLYSAISISDGGVYKPLISRMVSKRRDSTGSSVRAEIHHDGKSVFQTDP